MAEKTNIPTGLYIADDCCGCQACIQICPRGVLSAGISDEGFTIPVITDLDSCVDCGLCMKVCGIHRPPALHRTADESYMAQSRHTRAAKRSSSGGAFREIAAACIREYGAYVFGAAFDSGLRVRHICVNEIKNLKRLQGSKYVQSDMGDSYIRAKELLDGGEYVLFSGTPCQINGLHNFLRKDYERLMTVDIICHGVTSPRLLADYITGVERAEGRQVRGVRFRWKNPLFESSSSFYMMMMMNRGFRRIAIGTKDPYMEIFLNGEAFRECCYRCPFARTERPADFTLGDLDSHRLYPSFHPGESNSTILVNTPRAAQLWNRTISREMDFMPLNLQIEADYNHQLRHPSPRPDKRDVIYSDIYNSGGLKANRHSALGDLKTRLFLLMPERLKQWAIRLAHR